MSDDSTNSHAFHVQQIHESTPIADDPPVEMFQSQPEFVIDDDRPARQMPLWTRIVAAILFLIFFGFVVAGMLSGRPF